MAEALNSELNQYWSYLDTEERKSILSVMRSFIRLKAAKNNRLAEQEFSDEFKSVLQER